MTSEKLYSKSLTTAISNYRNSYLNPLNGFRIQEPQGLLDPLTTEQLEDESTTAVTKRKQQLIEVMRFTAMLNPKLQQVRSVTIPPVKFDPTADVNAYYDKLDEEASKQTESIKLKAEESRKSREATYTEKVQEATSHNKHLIDPIREKHLELLSKKDEFQYIFDHYEITPLDVAFDNLTREDFELLIDESIAICEKYEKRNADSKLNVLLEKLQTADNPYVVGAYAVGAIVAGFFLLPILCPYAFYQTFNSVNGMHKDIEKLQTACRLMAEVDYNHFVNEDDKIVVEDVDYTDIEDQLQTELSEVHDYSGERSAALAEVAGDSTAIEKMLNDTYTAVKHQYEEVVSKLTALLKRAMEKESQLRSSIKRFTQCQNDSVVMSHDYVLSTESGVIDVVTTLPLMNIIFDATKRGESIDLLKLYLTNMLLSVRVKQLTIEIYDPKNMGGDFTEFVTPETKPYLKINETELSKMLTTYRKYAQENVLALNKVSIDDFNKDAEERELVPKEYRLLILVSEFSELTEGKDSDKWLEFVKFSASQGVMIWILDTHQYQNTIWVSGNNANGEPIRYTPALGKEAVDTFSKALSNYKDRGIDYVSKFGDVFIPREKWWTFDTIKGIKMPYGLENGDPTRGLNVAPEIGDANVHALLGGATGAGKSAAINQLLISLICMYPPSELQIVYIDFKNVEAAKFTAGYDKVEEKWMPKEKEKELREKGLYYTRLSRIPHLRIISGTTDGEYALSVFEFLMAEMAHRQEIINKFGVTKVQEMRSQILENYNLEHNGDKKKGTWADMRRDWDWYKPNVYDKYGDLPRLLVIFDEFQVMYNPEFVNQRIIDQINGKITAITKLARAMAAHFWFTSQSMKGTMSKDTMANFSLRGALRCTTDVSEELLGNGAAGTIKAKFGFMYTNDSAGQNKDANRLWRVPFLDEKAMPGYINQLNDMLEEFNEKHDMAEFYDEKILVPATMIPEWYEQFDAFNSPDAFILGERANFSTNKAPVTMSLMEDNGENVLVSAFDRDDMLNLTMTMIKNLQLSDPDSYTLIMNVQDPETYVLLDVENIVADAFLPLASPKQDVGEFIDALISMVDAREEKGGPYKPVYVFCIQWERAPGIGADNNFKMTESLKALMRKAPTVGVHFIMCCREKQDLPRAIPASCNHRVAGLLPKDSIFFIETTKVEKLPDKTKDAGLFAFYEFGTTLHKFRIYQHVFTKQLKSREIVL